MVLRQMPFGTFAAVGAAMIIHDLHIAPLGSREVVDRRMGLAGSVLLIPLSLFCGIGRTVGALPLIYGFMIGSIISALLLTYCLMMSRIIDTKPLVHFLGIGHMVSSIAGLLTYFTV